MIGQNLVSTCDKHVLVPMATLVRLLFSWSQQHYHKGAILICWEVSKQSYHLGFNIVLYLRNEGITNKKIQLMFCILTTLWSILKMLIGINRNIIIKQNFLLQILNSLHTTCDESF